MKLVFQNCSPKIAIQNFWSQIEKIVLQKFLHFEKFVGIDIKKSQIRHFWSQIYECLLLSKTFYIDKFKGTDFICDNSVSTLQPKNT